MGRTAVALASAVAAAVLGCGGDGATGPSEPPTPRATRIAAVSGDGQTDTIGARLASRLVVRVTDESGDGVSSVEVRFDAFGASLSNATTRTDAAGLASTAVTLGNLAGVLRISATSGTLQGSPVVFAATVLPGAPTQVFLSPMDAFRFVGDSVQLDGWAADRQGNRIPSVRVVWSSSDPNVASVDTAGLVRARGAGLAEITASAGAATGRFTIQVNRTAFVDRRINSTTLFPHQEEPFLAIDRNGRVFAGWKEMNTPAGFNRVAFSYSLDGGVNWSTAVLVDNHAQEVYQSDPWLAVDENARLYFGRLEGDLRRVVVSHSDDGGLTWSSPLDVLDWDARQLVGLGRIDKPSLVADGSGRVFIAYYGEFSQSAPVNVVTQWSTDGGASWSPSIRMDSSDALQGTSSQAPVMAVAPDGTLYGAWWSRPGGSDNRNGNVVVVSSRDRGATWSSGVRVNPVAGSLPLRPDPNLCCRLPFPSIVVSPGGRVFLAWPDWDGQDWDVVVSWSDDRGGSWSAPVRISDVKRGDQWFVALGVDAQGTLHAAWYDSRSGDINLVYAKSTDGGQTWSPNVRASTRATPGPVTRLGDYIGVAVGADGTAYLAWTDGRGPDLDIYFARSTDL